MFHTSPFHISFSDDHSAGAKKVIAVAPVMASAASSVIGALSM